MQLVLLTCEQNKSHPPSLRRPSIPYRSNPLSYWQSYQLQGAKVTVLSVSGPSSHEDQSLMWDRDTATPPRQLAAKHERRTAERWSQPWENHTSRAQKGQKQSHKNRRALKNSGLDSKTGTQTPGHFLCPCCDWHWAGGTDLKPTEPCLQELRVGGSRRSGINEAEYETLRELVLLTSSVPFPSPLGLVPHAHGQNGLWWLPKHTARCSYPCYFHFTTWNTFPPLCLIILQASAKMLPSC